MGDTRIDSIYNVLVAGGSFEALGEDVNVMNDFVVTESLYAGLGRDFVNDVYGSLDCWDL